MPHPADLYGLSHGEVLRRFDARLAAMVHYFYLDKPCYVGAAGSAQNRCPHCHQAFDFAHKRAALLILALQMQAKKGERGLAPDEGVPV
ncbi:hypothetical protein GIW50_20465 [Pseudomonas syringae]|uniref:Uncharacterized protein n=1 Tax=Pseudomonas syringae TaxID=317 RepID=A0A9Q3ZUU9_PSESX|nr:hypothetical protein [Pseudomonas syringae]MCF5064373.1 hypothetical protein [Pseudomonas syringae]MCF5074631.1 hypothetical protein [Pseudomonas syringae]MCF5120766.1 hypothetical protein [Pseudomonas syringae]MCF5380602.1 hypothetical protein [Pseudomonas syringae]